MPGVTSPWYISCWSQHQSLIAPLWPHSISVRSRSYQPQSKKLKLNIWDYDEGGCVGLNRHISSLFYLGIWVKGVQYITLILCFVQGGGCSHIPRTPWFDLWICFRSIRSSVMEWTCFAPHPLKPSRTFHHQAITTVTDLIVIRVLVSKKKWVQGEVLKNLKDSSIFREML